MKKNRFKYIKSGFAATILACGLSLEASSAVKEIARFDFEESRGAGSDDAVSGLVARLTPDARWARGSFGGALALGEAGGGARIDGLPASAGDDSWSLFFRFHKASQGEGRFQNLLSSPEWKKFGGIAVYSDSGRSLDVRLRNGADAHERRLNVLKNLPKGKWCSLAVVFKGPETTVYVNGEVAARSKDERAFSPLSSVLLGGANGDRFGGYIDDLRIWRGALGEAEIRSLARDSRYDAISGYQDDGTGGIAKTRIIAQNGKRFAAVDGDVATLEFDEFGSVTSLKDKKSGRELIADPMPFAEAAFMDGRSSPVRRIERRGEDRFAFHFGKCGEAVVKIDRFKGGWLFKIESCTLKDVKSFEFCRLLPVCDKWKGSFVNAWSDEKNAVCVRSCDIKADPKSQGALYLLVESPFEVAGRAAALSAGPREGFREQLKSMTIAAGAPRSDAGGAWSMDSEVARWSYVFTAVERGDIDCWIDYVKRSGFSNLHINSAWTSCLGQCPVNTETFPGGLDGMRDCAAKAHAAGLHVGLHTLTACINPRDPWISPVCSEDLVSDATYTLYAPLKDGDTELLVNEMPVDKHVTVFTYSSNGNVLRIGGELVQYTGIVRDKKPYAFTGLVRGAFGTRRGGPYPAGTKADYLHQRYIAFYPKPHSKLADKLSSRLAEVYNTCNLDEFYFDGSEGMGTRYGIDYMRHEIFKKLKANNGHSPSIEASCPGANNWWFQTRMATTDHAVYGMKRFHDWHVTWAIDNGRKSNFLEPQMGWWHPRKDIPRARGHMLDEMEYFAGKNAGHDAPMSIQGVYPRKDVVGVRRQMTVLGWYEWARLARAFDPEVQSYLAVPRAEGRLRQDEDGEWMFTDVDIVTHRSGAPWARSWEVEAGSDCRAALRVEALFAPGKAEDGLTLLSGNDFASMEQDSADGVEVAFTPEASGEKGRTFSLSATNRSAERTGAWAAAKKLFGFKGVDLGEERIAFGMWVKGDGSGALLNLQFTTPRAYIGGHSDHIVRLDFTGWRYVTVLLRERDAHLYCEYRWPQRGYAATYRNLVDPEHLGSFSAYLNDIPKGGSAKVEIGEVTALEMVSNRLENASVSVNGEKFTVPFTMESGEYAELEGGFWTHYSPLGTALKRVEASEMPSLTAGKNALAFDGGENARGEVSVFAFGRRRPAFLPELTADMRKTMRYEGMMPFEYAPEKGLFAPDRIPVRPGEKAALTLDIYGPASRPTLTFKSFFGLFSTDSVFEADIAEDERLICRDGRKWRIEKLETGATVKEGELAEALPVLDCSTDFAFSAELPEGRHCVVDILKEYR